jgi:hypothetical protein
MTKRVLGSSVGFGTVISFIIVFLSECPAGAPDYLRQPAVLSDGNLSTTRRIARPTTMPSASESAVVTRWQQKKRTRDEVVYSAEEGSITAETVGDITATTPSLLWRRKHVVS